MPYIEEQSVESAMTTQESTKVQLTHLNEAIATLTSKVDMLLDMTKTVAVLKVEADNHRSYTQQLEVRVTQTTTKIEAGLDAEESSRIHANKNIHGRIDVLRKWMFTVGGGGMVVLALLGYVGESLKGFAATYMEAHDKQLQLRQEVDMLKERVGQLTRRQEQPQP